MTDEIAKEIVGELRLIEKNCKISRWPLGRRLAILKIHTVGSHTNPFSRALRTRPIPDNRVRSPTRPHAPGSPDVSGIKIFRRTSNNTVRRVTGVDGQKFICTVTAFSRT